GWQCAGIQPRADPYQGPGPADYTAKRYSLRRHAGLSRQACSVVIVFATTLAWWQTVTRRLTTRTIPITTLIHDTNGIGTLLRRQPRQYLCQLFMGHFLITQVC